MEGIQHLTHKQGQVLEFIRARIREDIPPTIREIARQMGFSSTGTVRDYLAALEKKGFLKRSDNLARSIELLKERPHQIPILADIPAGNPSLAYEEIQGYINTDDLFLGRLSQSDIFALRVKGESMIEAGIMDGDIAIIKKQPTASPGEIIAAMLDNHEVTLKRLKEKAKTFFLEAANKNYQPIHKSFTVIGKLVSIVRKY